MAVWFLNNGTSGWLPPVTTFYYVSASARHYLASVHHGLAMVRLRPLAYSQTMKQDSKTVETGSQTQQNWLASGARLRKGDNLMKRALTLVFVLLALAATSVAGDLPEAPSSVMSADPAIEIAVPASKPQTTQTARVETKIADKKFIALAVISGGSTFADSYTTLFARENWLAGKKNVCNVEVQSAYLYGTHPTVARAYAVASAKTVGSIAAAYYLRKHHSKFWSFPLIANSIVSLQGTTQNMIACN
jgi:hypothetical protein